MREQSKIFLLLVAVLAIVVGYAIVPGEISFGKFTIKKISLAQLRKADKNDSEIAPKHKKKKQHRSKQNVFIHRRFDGRRLVSTTRRLC